MSLRLRVMQRDGWPRPILHTGVPGCEIACLILSSISLSVTTNHPPPPKHTSHQTSQIDVTHWCAIRPMHWVSNRAPPHEEWWLRAGVRAGTLKVTHTVYTCIYAYHFSKRIIQSAPNCMHFFWVLCHLSPHNLLLLPSLTRHDQMGAFRVQRLTWTTQDVPFHHIFNPAFLYHFIPLSHLHHLTSFSPSTNPAIFLPLGTHFYHISHFYVNTHTSTKPQCCTRCVSDWLRG